VNGQMPGSILPDELTPPADQAEPTTVRAATPIRGGSVQARTAGEPGSSELTTACPVCGAHADFRPSEASASSPRYPSQAAEQTAKMIAWMAGNCHRRGVTVAEIAEVVGVSVRRLQTVCKRDFGRSPLHLLADIRLHRVHLALTGRAPAPASIAEAAALAGYSRRHRFRAAYRRRYGRDPVLPAQAIPQMSEPGEQARIGVSSIHLRRQVDDE
jgi:AraC-like DNA-binding protein